MFSLKSLGDTYDKYNKSWNSLLSRYKECSNTIYKLQNIKSHMKKFDKQGFCKDSFPSNYLRLCDKYEIEIAELEIRANDIDKNMQKLWDKMESIFKITKQNSKLTKITKLQKRQLERETCSICYEQHNIKQLVTTNCGHTFGKCCFSQLIDYTFDNCTDIVCPCCRNDKIELTRYVI
uniref:RING-type domain-containing protein n=1 Tax=viral metagenome TaxID=1070528 RepID=A0A6C0ESV6_9ZZZZ